MLAITISMIAVFVVGYAFIALENKIRINKAAVAMIMCGVLWVVLVSGGIKSVDVEDDIWNALASAGEILIFLICAMTIVALVDQNGGFDFITRLIKTRNKVKLVWLIAIFTFFLSAILDNMTTTIVMVMLMRKLLANYKERWVFAGLIVIAANAGGAWSPIGDVTTILLWVRGNVTSVGLISSLFLPSLVSVAVPAIVCSRILHGIVSAPDYQDEPSTERQYVTKTQSLAILILGVVLLLLVPVFRAVTGLPPYLGMVIALGIMWIVTELMYDSRPDIPADDQNRVSKVIHEIDMTTILFSFGVFMSIAALQSAGVLGGLAAILDKGVHNVYLIDPLIGLLSAVVDNVSLVAASMGMYPVADAAAVAVAADPAYAASFVADGKFWTLLAFCAGTGGSILIIGSAAGVVAMGLEKISFGWYLRNFSLMALSGYAAGIAVFLLEMLVVGEF